MNWIKGFRREVIEDLPPLRSDWHRFLLHIAAHDGYRIGEVPTDWHKRRAGRSHYGLGRIPISLLDVLVVWFLLTFSRAPMRFFGGLGLAALVASGLTYVWLLWLWLSQRHAEAPRVLLRRRPRHCRFAAVPVWLFGRVDRQPG